MSDNSPWLATLSPELRRLSDMSTRLKNRFRQTLSSLNQATASDDLYWQAISHASAVSPFHLHRQFQRWFQQTPGQYQHRWRLNQAVTELLDHPGHSVTRIALSCGYSSSQALAKAMKRTLGLSPSELRRQLMQGSLSDAYRVLRPLAQRPSGGRDVAEENLMAQLPIDHALLPERYFEPYACKDFSWDTHLRSPSTRHLPILILTRTGLSDNRIGQIHEQAVRQVEAPVEGGLVATAGHFLRCRVQLQTLVQYILAWGALDSEARHRGWRHDQDRDCEEFVCDRSLLELGMVGFELRYPVIGPPTAPRALAQVSPDDRSSSPHPSVPPKTPARQ